MKNGRKRKTKIKYGKRAYFFLLANVVRTHTKKKEKKEEKELRKRKKKRKVGIRA